MVERIFIVGVRGSPARGIWESPDSAWPAEWTGLWWGRRRKKKRRERAREGTREQEHRSNRTGGGMAGYIGRRSWREGSSQAEKFKVGSVVRRAEGIHRY